MSDRYAVLLRGVNIGGRKKVPKSEFQRVLEELGFSDVFVYINSGNAVFSSADNPSSDLVADALTSHFGFEVPTLLLPGGQVKAIAEAIPEHWSNDRVTPEKTGLQSNVLYLFTEIDRPEVIEEIGHKPDIETLSYVPGAVLQSISRQHQSKGSLAKLMGTRLYSQMTIRNVNTARKLAELIG